MSEENSLPAAGWYPDPADATRIRWWDGQTWTQHVAVADGAITPASPQTAPLNDTRPAPIKAGRNAQTKLTLWAGLFAALALWALSTLLTTMG
jgi:hypothetical protein